MILATPHQADLLPGDLTIYGANLRATYAGTAVSPGQTITTDTWYAIAVERDASGVAVICMPELNGQIIGQRPALEDQVTAGARKTVWPWVCPPALHQFVSVGITGTGTRVMTSM